MSEMKLKKLGEKIMTSKDLKRKDRLINNGYNYNGDARKSYEQTLRKRHNIPDDVEITIKQGFIAKDNETQKDFFQGNPVKTQRGRLLDAQFRMSKLVYDDIKKDISKVHKIVNKARDDIEILEIQNNSYEISESSLQTEVEAVAEEMCGKLSHSINKIAEKSYKTIYESLTETFDNVLGNADSELTDNLFKNEIYDTINLWLSNFKRQLLEDITVPFDDLISAKAYIQKGFFNDVFDSIKSTFNKVKNQMDAMIKNVVSYIQTTAQKTVFKIRRVEEYQVILSGHPKTCEKCKEMANKHFNIAELEVGETAPPFHPNCGCTMIPFISEEKDGSLRETAWIAANVAFELLLAQMGPLEKFPIPVYDWIKSAIWNIGTVVLLSQNCPLAQEMFTLGMYGGGKGMSKKATSLIVEAMQNSKHLNDEIFKLTESGKDFDTGIFSFGFKKDEDMDLYYAVQNVNMRIVGTNLGDGFWNIKVRSQDKYDFTTFRNSLAFADLANNLGEAMQRNGMMTEYDTLTEYDYVWKGR